MTEIINIQHEMNTAAYAAFEALTALESVASDLKCIDALIDTAMNGLTNVEDEKQYCVWLGIKFAMQKVIDHVSEYSEQTEIAWREAVEY